LRCFGMIYLASSWRNEYYSTVLKRLRMSGLTVYDFREEGSAFDWSDVDPTWTNSPGIRKLYEPAQLIDMYTHPAAERGWANDLGALQNADSCILVLPCGKSAHLEAGYSIGRKKPTAVYLPEPCEPELMWRLADDIISDLEKLITWAWSIRV
jgi:hypothetical protein